MGGSGTGRQYSGSSAPSRRTQSPRGFRPGVPATLFTAFFLPLLLALGIWQLNRAEEKETLFGQFAAGAGEAVPLDSRPGGLDDVPRYTRVEARGVYLDDRQFLLDNMVEAGRAGYRVLTPLLLADGRVLMVDRGWVPREFGESARTPEIGVAVEPRLVSGRLDRLPRPGIALEGEPGQGWPRVVVFPSRAELAQALGRELVPGLLLMDPDLPDGFVRNWRPAEFGPERHLGYAVQWFALAGTLVVLYMVWAFRKTD